MKTDNPLDRHLDIDKRIPEDVRESAVFVTDTMEIAWLSAQSVFEAAATPEMALQIYDRMVDCIRRNENQLNSRN
ncbi:MAG: hypothetical protein KZQ94_10295 [Candidatus Thiodiazotropha sp. (ex Troendleina suluensis)]|nr:hypothetical protein [Candidatus Thiodiazotropha sp. (ex Troendleina suluensis)]